MRKLLLFFAMLSVSIGTWATPTVSTSTWMQNNSAYETQTVASIWIENPGELADALSQVGVDFQYLHLSAFNSSNPQELSAEDIAALNALDVKTIEMNHVYAPYFEFDNPNVEYITLPYNWTKAQVKAVGETHKTHPNFKACISTSNTENSGDATLIAYLNEAGTMRDAILHSYFDTRDYKTLGSGSGDCSRVRTLVAMGNVCAKDISRAGVYDENGHYVINGVADENADPASSNNKNSEGGNLYATANGAGATDGAIVGCYDINVIDLSEAIIPDAYCADIIPGYAFVTTNLREFWIPEDPGFKTLPADFMNCSAAIHQICIPGNIETIKTRAFAGTNINYIWTTGSDPSIRYDNGATFITGTGNDAVRTQRYKTEVGQGYTATAGFDPAEEYPIFQSGDDNSFNYGTFTLPAGLKLIERYAFYSSTSVSDVYMLSTTAPECHVDAFNSSMYHANNTVQSSNIKEETDDDGNTIKIITREAYNNGINQPMAILHYPQDTTTPDLQRYTDPTREYSIATGYRDGKGNMLYFPTQTEFEVAEWEGTHGYLWNAWNIERTWYNQEITLGTGQGWYGGDFGSTGGYSAAGQEKANEFYNENPNPNPTTGVDKTDRSFYDVTANGTLSQPAGLQMYYNTVWEGSTLYPQAETEGVTDGQGNPVMETVPVRDENGNIIYDEAGSGATYEGNYIRNEVDIYTKADDGEYCHQLVSNDQGYYTISYSYPENANGSWCKAPWDGSWTQYQSYMGNIQRYDRVASGLIKFTDQWGSPRFNISDDYVLYETYDSEYKTLLDRFNKESGYEYTAATSSDAGPFYTMRTEEVQKQQTVKANDYRGWHQFVLANYGYNGVVPNEPIRSFISDNDWWTICEPYDLRYNDLIKFFGTDNGIGTPKKPYLSKLMYVIRDVEKGKITLMFSKNLMEYKEVTASDDQVHGTIDDETTWIGNGEGQYADEAALRAANPVILHKGVPYLIKPNLLEENGKIIGTRAFNVYKTDNLELYNRLNEAATLGAGAQASMVYDGEYTVPAYVVGLGKDGAGTEGVESSGTKTITNRDGSEFTYKDSENGGKLVYGGKEVDYKISADYTYTFVGSLYKSLMPQYCYFLGYDSKKKKAVFRYSAVQDKSGWNWNNETGIICPNFDTTTKIHSASSFNDPARWAIADANGTMLRPDDITMATGYAKSYTFDFGATNYFEMEEATGVSEMVVKPLYEETKVYDANGIYRGNSLQNLPKGVYIVNGKKYVVK